jgi:hypothetical protein
VNRVWVPRRFAAALALGFALALSGSVALYATQHIRAAIEEEARVAKRERLAMQARLSQAAQEFAEIGAKLDEYRRLVTRGVIGVERRLDWVDALLIVREENKLPDLKYSIGPQKPLNYPEVPQSSEVDILASPMTLELAMLHEGDLFRVLKGLRERLPPHMSVTDCRIERSGTATAPLRATCMIDLVTIQPRPEDSR